MSSYKMAVSQLLEKADICINGSRDWDMRVYNEQIFCDILRRGSLALGETYMNGFWDCAQLDQFFYRILKANLEQNTSQSPLMRLSMLKARLFNLQSQRKAFQNSQIHYDIGNDLYEAMLDKRMIYSCGYWDNADSLECAQLKKLDLICRKLKLEAGQKVLDIGCGWGGFAKYAAENYNVHVTGITVSLEQEKYAKTLCADLPVDIRLQDYRSLNEKFDRIVSIGMFEHVGHKNYPVYMEVVKRNLKKNGCFLLHTIGGNSSRVIADPWINAYIFPNGLMPSLDQIGKAIQNRFILEDWHNFGLYYDRTLMEWLKRFKQAWPELKKHYSTKFYRMWEYYLCCSAASFRAKKNHLWQIVLSHPENPALYQSVR